MSMDVQRTGYPERRRRRRWVLGGIVLLALAAVTAGVGLLEPAPPSVDRDTVYLATVERGEMRRQVRGHGTLVPEEIRWIPASTGGRVERIRLEPGDRVEPETIILELSNPEVAQAARDAESALIRARAELAGLRLTLVSQELDQQAQVAALEGEFREAKLRAEADVELHREGLLGDVQQKISRARADALETRHEVALRRQALIAEANAAQLDAKNAELEQHRNLARLRADQREALAVRAGLAGVIQQIPVEVGQDVGPGATLALIAEPTRLKAEVLIPATQARELRLDLPAEVDTRNGVVKGRVARIDPTVRQGTVQVDVELLGSLPPGARPDLSIEGRVEIERLDDVLFVSRPASGGAAQRVRLFRVDPGGERATRVSVRLGRASVRTIEVVEGLAEGETIVISDTRRWDDHARLKFK